MDNFDRQETESGFINRLRKPTPTIASGGSFSLAILLPSVVVVAFVLTFSIAGLLVEGYEKTEWWKYFSYAVTPLSFALLAGLYLKARKLNIASESKKQCCHWKYYILALGMQIGLFALSEVNGYFLSWLERFGYQAHDINLPSLDGFGVVGVLFVIAVLPAVFEEIIFRGTVLSGLKRNFTLPVAVLLCGGLFALYHQRPEQTVYQFLCGSAYALLALRSGSVLPTILAHFMNNATIILLYANGITAIPMPVFITLLIVGGAMIIGVLAYLIFIDKSKTTLSKPTQKKDFFLSALPGILVVLIGWITTLFAGF